MFEYVIFELFKCVVFALGMTIIALPICALLVGTIKFVKGSNSDDFGDYVVMLLLLLATEMFLCLFFFIGYDYLQQFN